MSALALSLALSLGTGLSGCSEAPVQDPTGLWHLKSADKTQRATGGIRTVLLRVDEVGEELRGQITSVRDTFLDFDGLRFDDGVMGFRFGAHEYTLELDGDQVAGTAVSPLGSQEISGTRQRDTLLYVGDRPPELTITRTGIIGHRIDLVPPEEEQDPTAWVLGRVRSPDELALIVFRRTHRVVVGFTNADEFQQQLRAHAGQQVRIAGVWIGDEIRLESIEAAD